MVNRVVSAGYETVLTNQQQQRLDDAAETLADRLSRPTGLARAQAIVTRLANSLGGEVRVISTDGTTLAAFGRTPTGDTTRYAAPIELDGQVVATLEASLPAQAGDRGFLPLFNVTLAIAGLVSVLVIAFASASIAGRLTRPLRDVAVAARRLEAGDVGARATGGEDRESTELAEAFNAMADRLERSEMLRRRAASDIAHDLATPATVLESQLQAMIDGVVPNDAAGLEAARSTAAALGGVIADIDDLARAEAAPLQARPAAVDLAVAIPEIALGARRGPARPVGPSRRRGPGRNDRLGGSGSSRPGAPQRRRQRAGPQPVGRRGLGPRRAGGGSHPDPDRGPGTGHRGRGPAARLRALLPRRHGARDGSGDRPAERPRSRPDDRARASDRERRTDRGRADRSRRDHVPGRDPGRSAVDAWPPGGDRLDAAGHGRPVVADWTPRHPGSIGARTGGSGSSIGGSNTLPVMSRTPRPWVRNVHAQRTRTTIRLENPIR